MIPPLFLLNKMGHLKISVKASDLRLYSDVTDQGKVFTRNQIDRKLNRTMKKEKKTF